MEFVDVLLAALFIMILAYILGSDSDGGSRGRVTARLSA